MGAYSRLGAYSNKYGNYFFLAGRGEGQWRELTQSSKAHARLVSFAAVIRVVTKETNAHCTCLSGRKNVLRKLVRILYRRLKAGFSVC